MTQALQQTLRDRPIARWSALAIVSITMMCGYFLTDVISPLESILTKNGWTADDYGFFSGAYGYINVFLLMLFFGGIILDKMGIRFTGILSTGLMLLGAGLKYYAFKSDFGAEMFSINLFGSEFLKMPMQVALSSLGFAIFGVGAEITGITVSKIIVKWFEGKEMAMALGLQVALARLGTAAALAVSPLIVKSNAGDASAPVLVGLIVLIIGFLSYFVYVVMDKKEDDSQKALKLQDTSESSEEEGFKFSDIKSIVANKAFWLITLLCLMFYSAVFPFLKFATKLMIEKYNAPEDYAGFIPALLPFGTILLTPFFGSIYDRKGKGATLMIIGSAMLALVHVLFAMPFMNIWYFAVVVMLILGVAFSLVPSAMWPSVPKIIPMKQLGSAYAIIFYIQNIGLSLVPVFIGKINAQYGNYSITMGIFAVFGLIAVLLSVALKLEDAKRQYGLELPNVKK